jgi:two-component system, NarL family, response regulator NreC
MPIRVLIADDASCIRNAVRDFLENTTGIQVCGEASNYLETLQLAAKLKPDVILLDLYMPDRCDFEPAFVKSMLLSTSQVLAMSLLPEESEPHALASEYGAVAVLDKARLYNELMAAIRSMRA